MAFKQWRVGQRPEVRLIRFVVIQQQRFDIDEVINVLEDLEASDGIFHPIAIRNMDLARALLTEGMAYPNHSGGYGGTNLIPEALDGLYRLRDAKDIPEVHNPQYKEGFMDETTFDNELGHTEVEVYGDPDSVRDHHRCAKSRECGIVKVVVYATEVEQWPSPKTGIAGTEKGFEKPLDNEDG